MEIITARIRVLTVKRQPIFTVLLPEDTSWSTVNSIVRQRYGQLTTSGAFRHKCDHEWNYVQDDEE